MSTTTMTEREAAHVFRNAQVDGTRIILDDTPDGYRAVIPAESDFDAAEVDYLAAPDIAAIADRLRAEKAQFAEIRGYRIAYFWKRKGGQSGGKVTLGKCARTPALVKAIQPSTWTIWLAADHVRDYRLTDHQVEALVFHELLHCALKEVEVRDKDTGETDTEYRPALVGHDLEMFNAELVEYGLWTRDLQRAKPLFEQADLPGLDDPVVAGGQA